MRASDVRTVPCLTVHPRDSQSRAFWSPREPGLRANTGLIGRIPGERASEAAFTYWLASQPHHETDFLVVLAGWHPRVIVAASAPRPSKRRGVMGSPPTQWAKPRKPSRNRAHGTAMPLGATASERKVWRGLGVEAVEASSEQRANAMVLQRCCSAPIKIR